MKISLFHPLRLILPVIALGAATYTTPLQAFDPGTFKSGSSVGTAQPAGIRIVNCDQKVASRKRGVCMNEMAAADFKALSPGVSWYYNWATDCKDKAVAGEMEFIPMVWGNGKDAVNGLQHYLGSAAKKPRVVLAINEPNLKGQAFITPEQTAKLYIDIKGVADKFKIPVVGPNMALGSPDNSSIKAVDPITRQQTTYTFMVPFIKATLSYMNNTEVTAVAAHSYGGIGEIKWMVEMMHKEFNRPVWVTEYAQWNASSPEAARDFLIEATEFLERCPYVEGYAWFKDRAKDNPKISLLDKQPGKLSALGEAYVNLPPHDPDLYYRIPGRLQAENFVTADRAQIRSTVDTDGKFLMKAEGSGGTLEYNIQVDTAGTYVLKFRVAGSAGKLDVLKGEQVIGSAETPNKNDWETVEASVPLTAGAQKLKVRYGSIGQCLNWIEFAKR